MENGEINDGIMDEIRQTFELFDSDHDGKVSTKEISVIMRSLGMLISDKEMDELVARLDTDGNGTVEFAEFEDFMLTSGVLNKIPDEMDENLRDAFKILDKNNDGYIDKEELIFYMTKFGDKMAVKDAEEMIEEADQNGDGRIDYKEYVRHMTGKL